MKRVCKRGISIVLAVVLVIGLVGTAFAQSDNEIETYASSSAKTIDLLFICGQSNAVGWTDDFGNYNETYQESRDRAVACDEDSIFSTVIPLVDYTGNNSSDRVTGLTFEDATTNNVGSYISNSVGSSTSLNGNTLTYKPNALSPNGTGKSGMDGAIAYEWNLMTGHDVWICNSSASGVMMNTWVPGAESNYYDITLTAIKDMINVVNDDSNYTLGNVVMFWMQGESDTETSKDEYYSEFTNMVTHFKNQINGLDIGIILPRGTDGSFNNDVIFWNTGAKQALYQAADDYSYVYMASDVNKYWTDDDAVKTYFTGVYGTGNVNYPIHSGGTLVVPTTFDQTFCDPHYRQVGHNENGLTAADTMVNELGLLSLSYNPDNATVYTPSDNEPTDNNWSGSYKSKVETIWTRYWTYEHEYSELLENSAICDAHLSLSVDPVALGGSRIYITPEWGGGFLAKNYVNNYNGDALYSYCYHEVGEHTSTLKIVNPNATDSQITSYFNDQVSKGNIQKLTVAVWDNDDSTSWAYDKPVPITTTGEISDKYWPNAHTSDLIKALNGLVNFVPDGEYDWDTLCLSCDVIICPYSCTGSQDRLALQHGTEVLCFYGEDPRGNLYYRFSDYSYNDYSLTKAEAFAIMYGDSLYKIESSAGLYRSVMCQLGKMDVDRTVILGSDICYGHHYELKNVELYISQGSGMTQVSAVKGRMTIQCKYCGNTITIDDCDAIITNEQEATCSRNGYMQFVINGSYDWSTIAGNIISQSFTGYATWGLDKMTGHEWHKSLNMPYLIQTCEHCGLQEKLAIVGVKAATVSAMNYSYTDDDYGITTYTLTMLYYDEYGEEQTYDIEITDEEEVQEFNDEHTWVLVDKIDTTCTTDGYEEFICEDCGITKNVTYEAYGHNWEPTFDWSDDYSTCVAVFECEKCDDIQTVECTITADATGATCTGNGHINYHAECVFEGEIYNDTITVPIYAYGHDIKCDFTWDNDGSSCVAHIYCTHGDVDEYLDCTLDTIAYTPTECENNGFYTVHAEVEYDGTVYENDRTFDIPANGHIAILGNHYWNEGHSILTEDVICEICGELLYEIDVPVDESYIEEPTCTEDGIEVWYTSFEFNDETYTEYDYEMLPALGHEFSEEDYYFVWDTDENNNVICKVFFPCQREGCEYEAVFDCDVTENIVEPTCTENGETTYYAEWSYIDENMEEPFVVSDSMDVVTNALDHEWGEPVFNWDDFNLETGKGIVTATFTCIRGCEETVECTVTSEEDGDSIIYTVTVEFEGEEYTDTAVYEKTEEPVVSEPDNNEPTDTTTEPTDTAKTTEVTTRTEQPTETTTNEQTVQSVTTTADNSGATTVESPKTGDNNMLWICITTVCIVCVCGGIAISKRKFSYKKDNR